MKTTGMEMDKLYKKTATGAIQVWWMELDGAKYRTVSGKLDGVMVTSAWTTCESKNVGRSNESSPHTQAESEVESAYALKRKAGYRDTPEGAVSAKVFRPMLAEKYEDRKAAVQRALDAGEPVWSQPKLDGIRCIARASGLWSRPGNPIVACPHIVEALRKVFEKDPSLVLDGELYTHTFKDDFNAIVSVVKKTKPSEEDLAESARLIEYWVYDSPAPGEDFKTRTQRVKKIVGSVGLPLVYVDTALVGDVEELDAIYALCLDAGYEGQMIRLNGPYETKRSRLLLKRKEWMDKEFEICGIYEGQGNRSGMAGYAVLRLGDGTNRTFRSNIKGDRAFLKETLLLASSLVGRFATVEFQNLTPDGIPRFPRIKAFHETTRW